MLSRRVSLITTLMILFLTAPLITSDSQAQTTLLKQRRGNVERGFEGSATGGEMLEQLDLSEEQRQQIAEIQEKYAPEIQQNQEELRSAYEELREMMVGNTSDEVIRQQHQEIGLMRQDLADLRLEGLLEVREVLTLEQRQELADMMQERRQAWSERFGNRRARRQPPVLLP